MRALRLLLTVALVGGALTSVARAAGDNPKEERGSVTQECNDGAFGHVGDISYSGPLSMWPPNHKYDTGTLTATATDPDDGVNIVWTATHNQYVDGAQEMNGSGHTVDDITPPAGDKSDTGSVSQDFLIRSERSGRDQAGRVYTISGTATFTDEVPPDTSASPLGSSCDFSFDIVVPHDQGHGND